MPVFDPREQAAASAMLREVDLYERALRESERFRAEYPSRMNVVPAAEMPFERSRHGLIKHIIREEMQTKECCLDVYMQFLPPGRASGRHRHLSEEVFYVVEGHGYDLHWDVKFDCDVEYDWQWEDEPKRFDWGPGDFVYIPPYCTHQHFNADPAKQARIIVINSRIVKPMGLDWFEQVEDAEAY